MANYFKVDRKITKWKYFKYPAYTCVWIYLLSRANYKDGYSMGCLLHAGQLYETYDSISEHVNTPKGTVRRILQVLRDEHQVSTQVSNHGMIITIEKWAEYQDDGYKSEHSNEHPSEQPNEHPSEQPNEQPNEHQSIAFKAFKASKALKQKDLEDDDIEIDDAISVYRRRAQQAYQGTGDINLAYDKLEQIAADIPSDRRKFIIPNLDRVTKLIDQFWIEGDIGNIKNPEGYIWSILSRKPRKKK
jgi:hypothetical protein